MVMRIIIWNVQGLGDVEKKQEVRKLVSDKIPSILYLQETKLTVIDELTCAALWGNLTYSYSFWSFVGGIWGFVGYMGLLCCGYMVFV